MYNEALDTLEVDDNPTARLFAIGKLRPFLRMLHCRAELLHVLGKVSLAIERYEELIALTENDNQGVRYKLMSANVMLEHREDVMALCERFVFGDTCESNALVHIHLSRLPARQHVKGSKGVEIVWLNFAVRKQLLNTVEKRTPTHIGKRSFDVRSEDRLVSPKPVNQYVVQILHEQNESYLELI